jgi:glycosyltransferase involved in cell wall biosynthesis
MLVSKPKQPTPVAERRARSALRIGIDGEALRKPLSGVGHYVYNLCRELEQLIPDAHFFAYSRLPESRLALPSARWTLRTETHRSFRRLPSFVWLKTRGRALCDADQLDVFWANRTLHPRLSHPVRTLCTVHDLNHLLVPETMQKATLWSHRLWFSQDLGLANHIVTNSHGTAERVRVMLGKPVDDVVAPGLDPAYRPQTQEQKQAALQELLAHDIAPPYLLSVATQEPRKNIEALVDAFVALKREGQLRDYRLALVGAQGWGSRVLDRRVRAAAEHGVVATGYLPGPLLPALYAGAEAFVLPSLYEGFGMPVLEARACGTRVLVSDSPELREAGGPHATLVDPSTSGIRRGILRALSTPRVPETDLREQYSWKRAATRLAHIFSQSEAKAEGSS